MKEVASSISEHSTRASTGRFAFPQNVNSVKFSFYSPDEIRKISVGQVTSSVSLDGLGHPLPGGLHDLRFGPTTREHGLCLTCGLNYTQCPGHLGHLDLVVPVYNPVVFQQMYRILQTVCFSCKHFRHSAKDMRLLYVQLLLLEAGMLTEAIRLESDIQALGSSTGFGKETSTKGTEKAKDGIDPISDLLRHRESIANIRLAKTKDSNSETSNYKRRHAGNVAQVSKPNAHARNFRNEIIASFFLKAPNSCRRSGCSQQKSILRKDGYSKIFVRHRTRVESAAEVERDDMMTSDQENEDSLDLPDEDIGREKFLHQAEVLALFKAAWENDSGFSKLMWGGGKSSKSYMAFFLQTIPIPPPRFRPMARMGSLTFEHPQNVALLKCIKLNETLGRSYSSQSNSDEDDNEQEKGKVLTDAMNTWVELQQAVNGFIDSTKVKGAGNEPPPGIRQNLEKKEGLFRQNMMGKRVNFAARSVISPDPYITTDEVGLPVMFARQLAYPEPVTKFNAEMLASMVRNGPEVFPGAHYIEDEDGRLVELRLQNKRRREELAEQILSSANADSGSLVDFQVARASRFTPSSDDGIVRKEHNKALAPLALRRQKKVWRHVKSGDVMLANRQPTLHKASLMAHKVRVINNDAMQTIRLHYANCNSYNADFDGDEINLHLPQGELCRAEAFELAYTDKVYINSTNGSPLRGLIQDHVDMGVVLTQQGTFLTREEISQMLFVACGEMRGCEGSENRLLPPAILKPKELWTGKQLISCILMYLVGSTDPAELITMGPSKTKIPAHAWKHWNNDVTGSKSKAHKRFLDFVGDELGGAMGQTKVVIRQGIMCTGVLDKAQFGASAYGLVHCIYEIYGPGAAGELLSSFGRLFTFCAQKYGHTCAIDDLLLNSDAENFRKEAISASVSAGVAVSAEFADMEERDCSDQGAVAEALHHRLCITGESMDEAILDSKMQVVTSATMSKVIDECLPKGQYKPFPDNCFSLMVFSGAKGSLVNHSQISCGLGQQSLEGRRVPRSAAGKSLPCFSSYDPTPRAGGYVSDRFLTGVRPQEYYFHCMAGREGLIDTAVKTANSGYLQRCLIKHLENVSVGYDRTVRLSDGGVLQFVYGGDGLDAACTSFLNGSSDTLSFLYANIPALSRYLKVGYGVGELRLNDKDGGCLDLQEVPRLNRSIKAVKQCMENLNDHSLFSTIPIVKDGEVKCARPIRLSKKQASKYQGGAFSPGMHRARVVDIDESSGEIDVQYFSDGKILRGLPKKNSAGQPNAVGIIPDPVASVLSMDKHLGVTSEYLHDQLEGYIAANPAGLLSGDEDDAQTLRELLWVKYMRALVAPGENVGVIAAQGIGEPSTQMTLNTFHLAGHGAANVTLGIPRLRELLMTASQTPKTPSMTLPCLPHLKKQECEKLRAMLSSLSFDELLSNSYGGITVVETLRRVDETTGALSSTSEARTQSGRNPGTGTWFRECNIQLSLQPLKYIASGFNLSLEKIIKLVSKTFFGVLCTKIEKELKRLAKSSGASPPIRSTSRGLAKREADSLDVPDTEDGKAEKKGSKQPGAESDEEDDQQDDDFGEAGENSTLRLGRKEEMDYDDDDADSDVTDAEFAPDSEAGFDNENESDGLDENNISLPPGRKSATYNGRKITEIESEYMSVYSFWHSAAYWNEVSSDSKVIKPARIDVRLRFNASQKKLLLIDLAEAAAKESVLRCVPGVTSSYLVEKGNPPSISIQTDGSNLHAAWEFDKTINVNRLYTNDVGAILRVYGVEAAREAICREVKNVFGVYGIGVDERHLGITADYMTFEGEYKPLNRIGMKTNTSPYVRMTFETSTSFLTAAALESETDRLDSVSSRLVMGQLLRTGTGAFDVMVPTSNQERAALEPHKKRK